MTVRGSGRGFTLVELLTVMTISAGMVVVISLFLQSSLTSSRRAQEEAILVGHVKNVVNRLRKCVRHSLSALSNFQGEPPALTVRPFEATESLFFITDHDSNGDRELHFVWYDRTPVANGLDGTGALIHCWKSATQLQAGLTLAGVPPPYTMPPSMTGPTFGPLLAYLRNSANFNLGGRPSLDEGWEILLDCRTSPANSIPTSSAPPVRIERRRFNTIVPGTPPVSSPPYAAIANSSLPLPFGLAFNIQYPIQVPPAAPTTWLYLSSNPIGNRLCLTTLPGLATFTTAPYPATPPAAYGTIQGPACQLYFAPFIDSNLDRRLTEGEAYVPILTTLNLLLIPSAS